MFVLPAPVGAQIKRLAFVLYAAWYTRDWMRLSDLMPCRGIPDGGLRATLLGAVSPCSKDSAAELSDNGNFGVGVGSERDLEGQLGPIVHFRDLDERLVLGLGHLDWRDVDLLIALPNR